MSNSLFSRAKSTPSAPVSPPSPKGSLRPWKLLLVDDDEDVILVSEMALQGAEFEGHPLEILSARSASQARSLIQDHPDLALILIDVVMEHDQAGLDLVQWIREEHKNSHVRLILRTGQPGQAPEEEVIQKYEINDYKHKTDLTAIRLKTTAFSALRGYRDIKTIASHQRRLEQMMMSCSKVLRHSAAESFLRATQQELSSFLKQDNVELSVSYHSYAPYAEESTVQYRVTESGILERGTQLDSVEAAIDQLANAIDDNGEEALTVHSDHHFIHRIVTDKFSHVIVMLRFSRPLSQGAQRLLPMFTTNLGLAFDNVSTKGEVETVQQELMLMLSEAIEERSKETGAHVRRVALICEFIGRKLGLPERHVQMIKDAAPMHDLGKIGVPESILHKPGKLTDEEWQIMRSHPQIGHKLLNRSKHGLPRMGAMVSLSHHEKWDGSGYPNGVQGEDIPLEGRIMAIADVIDALGSNRSYKKSWSKEDISTLLEQEKGKHFDPKLCDLVIEYFDDIMHLRSLHPDAEQEEH